MSEFFNQSVKRLLGIEGDFGHHPDDSGGATRWGVTEYLARAHGYTGAMREYPVELALEVYRKEFWDRMRLDEVCIVSYSIAYELFDTEVNTPIGTAPTYLQRCLNVANDRGKHYPDLMVDGRIGPATIEALRAYMRRRGPLGETVMLRGLNGLQSNHYTTLAERREKDEAFWFGWHAHRVQI